MKFFIKHKLFLIAAACFLVSVLSAVIAANAPFGGDREAVSKVVFMTVVVTIPCFA